MPFPWIAIRQGLDVVQSHPLCKMHFGHTKPHQLRWGDRQMGTVISCTNAVRRLSLGIWLKNCLRLTGSIAPYHLNLSCVLPGIFKLPSLSFCIAQSTCVCDWNILWDLLMVVAHLSFCHYVLLVNMCFCNRVGINIQMAVVTLSLLKHQYWVTAW